MRRYGLSGNFDFVHLKIVSHHRIKAGIFNKSKKKKKKQLIHTKPIFLIVLTLSKLSKKKKKKEESKEVSTDGGRDEAKSKVWIKKKMEM